MFFMKEHVDKKVVILLGAPGSGKGTQAKHICDMYGYAHVSTGELLRTLLNDPQASAEDKGKAERIKDGQLVSDELIYKLAFKEITKQLALKNGVVLDGAIRSVTQAEAYQTFFRDHHLLDDIVVIEIAITDEMSLERLLYRQTHATEVRDDDATHIIQKRVKLQGNTMIAPIAAYYDSLGLLRRIDGHESIETVFHRICQVLGTRS